VQDVVEVFSLVRQEVPCRLLLVGDGPDRPKIEQKCRELGTCDSITFTGNLPVVEDVLAGADLFLLPSETESFGLAALEAMASEVPVIATDVGGLPEVVDHGKNGFLCPVGDTECMARAAITLLQDEDLRRSFAQAARASAVERFDQGRVVGRYRALYEQVVGNS
jgi:L-malate glycosyltransferase